MKSKGYSLEHAHMTLHDHLEYLLCLLTLTYLWCVLVSLEEECRMPAHGRRAWKVVPLGLRKLVRVISQPETRRGAQLETLIGLLSLSQT